MGVCRKACRSPDMMKKKLLNTMIAGLMAASHARRAAPGDEIVSTATDQHSVAVTIYNDNLALVKDARRVRLARHINRLARAEG